VNEAGRRRSRRFHGTYTEARAALEAFEAEGKAPGAGSVLQLAESWREWRRASGQFAPGTLENDGRAVRALARTALAQVDAADATGEDVRQALIWLRQHPVRGSGTLSGTTLNKLHRSFFQIFEYGAAGGAIASNPMARLQAPKVDTQERRALTPAQIFATLDALDALPMDGRTMAVRLILYLGLRRGEACGVLSSDLDLAAGVLHVRHAVKERTGAVGTPKSAAGVRDLPLPERLAGDLSQWLEIRAQTRRGDAATLCCNAYGATTRPQLLQRWWNKARAGLGCEGFTLHELRHSNLSMVARVMPSAFDLQKWAGWSSLEPARVYIHEDMDALRAGVAAAFGAPPGIGCTENAPEKQ
jgi:integrase